MKKLIFVLAMLVVAQVGAAEWVKVEGSTYVDKSTIRKSGDVVLVWEMTVFTEIQSVGTLSYNSMKLLKAYSCRNRASKTQQVNMYYDNKTVYTLTSKDIKNITTEWEQITPGSKEESSYEYACSFLKKPANNT